MSLERFNELYTGRFCRHIVGHGHDDYFSHLIISIVSHVFIVFLMFTFNEIRYSLMSQGSYTRIFGELATLMFDGTKASGKTISIWWVTDALISIQKLQSYADEMVFLR